jgi:hypothetical protein
MEKLKNNFENLNLLASCSKKIKDSLIKKGERDLILSINECVINTLNGNITLSPKEKLKLKKYKYSLRKLLKNKSIHKKKKILIQEGGFLQILLPSAISLISTLLDTFVNKK